MSSGHSGRRADAAHVVHAEFAGRLATIFKASAAVAHFVGRPIGALAQSVVGRRAAVGLWAILVVASLVCLARYSATPGAESNPPPLAAAGVPFSTNGAKHLLVMAIHPQCPCSRASVGELTRLITRHREELSCEVLVSRPRDAAPDWIDTSSVTSARALPGTAIVVDVDGRYAQRLGMATSGAVVLYSPDGTVEFHGGITPSRGHWGDNLGSDAIGAILAGKEPLRRTAPVYGCPIY